MRIAADVLGVIVAFLGIYLGQKYNNPQFDGFASILIGIILAGVSIFLARESRSLLMGETPSERILKHVIAVTEDMPEIQKVIQHLSMVLGPDEFLLILKVRFGKKISGEKVLQLSDEIKSNIQRYYPAFKKIFVEPD